MNIFQKAMSKIGMKSEPILDSDNTNQVMPSDTMAFLNMKSDSSEGDIFKAYIQNFLFKPPYGMPRKVDTPGLKRLSRNPYIFSVIKTLSDGAATTPWSIKVKDEFQEDGTDHEENIDTVTKFFRNPNGNEESMGHLLRALVTDICECDSGVIVKIFNRAGEFKQLFVRDGSLFLKNPDIYGYMGDKADFMEPLPDGFNDLTVKFQDGKAVATNRSQQETVNKYNELYSNSSSTHSPSRKHTYLSLAKNRSESKYP